MQSDIPVSLRRYKQNIVNKEDSILEKKLNNENFLVKSLFHTILSSKTNVLRPPETINQEIDIINKTAKLLVKSIEDGTLTDKEANSVLSLLAQGFTSRRLEHIFDKLSDSDDSNWFVATTRSYVNER